MILKMVKMKRGIFSKLRILTEKLNIIHLPSDEGNLKLRLLEIILFNKLTIFGVN